MTQHTPCELVIEKLRDSGVLTDPFDLGLFISRLEQQRGRQIRLVAMSALRGVPCGLYIKSATSDYLCYARSGSMLHQCHIILHELGHLVLDHRDSGLRREDLYKMLLPDLDPELVRAVLCRSGYADPAEDEAETFADLILAPRVLTPGLYSVPNAEPPPEIADVIKNIERAWGARGGTSA